MDKDQLFNAVANYLAGSCMSSNEAFSSFCDLSEPKLPEPTQSDLDEFEVYLESIDQFCCENCGWWSYPGEWECDCIYGEDDED